MDGRQLAVWLAGALAMVAGAAVAASGLGPLGVAVVLLPAAMIAYSAAMTAVATAADRRACEAIERANTDLRRFVLGETSSLVGLAREQQHAIQAGYDGAIRAALEVALAQARPGVQSPTATPAAAGGW
jgi:hypothetical protein